MRREGSRDSRKIGSRGVAAWLTALLAGVLTAASAPAVTMDLDFAGNALPSDWSVAATLNAGGIRNERLETAAIDQGITIAHVLAAPSSGILIRFRGEIRDSYWGSYNEVQLRGASSTATFSHLNRGWNEGDLNVVLSSVTGETALRTTYPESFPTFLYEIELIGATATYRVIDETSSSVVAELVRAASPLAALQVEEIRIHALHTTGAGSTWIDDLHVELLATPEPGTAMLVGAGLLGLGWRRRRPARGRAA